MKLVPFKFFLVGPLLLVYFFVGCRSTSSQNGKVINGKGLISVRILDCDEISDTDCDLEPLFETTDVSKVQLPIHTDSLIIAYGVFYNKETSLESSDEFWRNSTAVPTREGNMTRIWREAKLNTEQQKQLANYLISPNNYKNTRAGLNDDDIFIYYYSDGKIVHSVAISSTTRNIVLRQGQQYIYNSINKDFEQFITKLLRSTKIWSNDQTFFDFDY